MNNYSPNPTLRFQTNKFHNQYSSNHFITHSPHPGEYPIYSNQNYNYNYANPNLLEQYNSDLYKNSPPIGSINLNNQRFAYHPINNSPPYVNYDQMNIPTYASIPAESVFKIEKNGDIKFKDEKKNILEKHEEKILVTSAPETKLVEEIVEHQIEVTEPPYIDYEEKEISKTIEIPQPPLLTTIEEVVQKEIYVPQPPQFKTITEKIRVPRQKFPEPKFEKVQETVMKEIILQPPPKEITVRRTLEEKITPISAETKGETQATMYQDDVVQAVKWVPKSKYFTNYNVNMNPQISPYRQDINYGYTNSYLNLISPRNNYAYYNQSPTNSFSHRYLPGSYDPPAIPTFRDSRLNSRYSYLDRDFNNQLPFRGEYS